jgi:hypothetical protein
MNKFSLSKTTKAILIAGGILLIYGYLCRFLDLYFFWESKYLGWLILLIGGGGAAIIDWIKFNKRTGKKTVGQKVMLGVLTFAFLIQVILLIVLPNTNAYEASKRFLRESRYIETHLGDIEGISIIPIGAISVSQTGDTETGEAVLHLIVKGSKQYRDITLYLLKREDTEWQVMQTDGIKGIY